MATAVNKIYNFQYGVGKAKYVVNFHDGIETHKDGSAFFGIATFKNKKKLEAFEKDLLSQGYQYK